MLNVFFNRLFCVRPRCRLPTCAFVVAACLQSCLKVANEAPTDLRSNLQRSWAMFDQEKLDSCTAAKEFRACLFGLCFFHSLVLGRRRFGQLGWSRSYGFAAGDLNICANILHSYWEAAVSADGRGAPWQELRYIFGEIMYGGHITDFFDRRVTTSYLEVSSGTRVNFEEEAESPRGDPFTRGFANIDSPSSDRKNNPRQPSVPSTA